MGGALLGAVSQGILWGIMVLGVFITYKLLDIADLTVDGSFALGGSVCAVAVVAGVDPLVAIVAAMVAGMVAGAVTGFLHTVFEIPAILAGILTQIALWSINLRIMGKSNTPLLQNDTVFSRMTEMTGLSANVASIVVGVIVALVIIGALYWFFGTEIGSALRATGNNEDMIRALGVSTAKTKMIALMLSNALVGLSGGLICQSQKYADIGMGTGAIVIGLAAIVIGEGLGRLTPRQARRLQEPPGIRRRRFGGVLPHPRDRAAARHGCQRHEAAVRRHRRPRAVRPGRMGEVQAALQLHEGR